MIWCFFFFFFWSGKIFLLSGEFRKGPDNNVGTALSSDWDDSFRNQRDTSALMLMQQKPSDHVIFKANASTHIGKPLCSTLSWKKLYIVSKLGHEKKNNMKKTHVFSSNLFFGELNLNKRSYCGEKLPPRPVLHAMILLNVLLDATYGQILDLRDREGFLFI